MDISEATKKYFRESSYPPMVKIIRTLLSCVNLLALFHHFLFMFVKRFNCMPLSFEIVILLWFDVSVWWLVLFCLIIRSKVRKQTEPELVEA